MDNEIAVKGAEVQSGVGTSPLACSLSDIEQDPTRWKTPSEVTDKPSMGPDDIVSHSVRDGTGIELDDLKSVLNERNNKEVDFGVSIDWDREADTEEEAGTDADNVKLSWLNHFPGPSFRILDQSSCNLKLKKLSETVCKQISEEWNKGLYMRAASTSGTSVRCSVFKENVHAAILDGKAIDMSFDNFPYYLRYNYLLLHICCNVMNALNLVFSYLSLSNVFEIMPSVLLL